MDLDVRDLFGDQEAVSVGGSDAESDREQQPPNFGEEENERQEAGGAGADGAPPPEGQPVKPKRVVQFPRPKLDAHRLAGPRGMFALHKTFRNFKLKGKGYEQEDLQEVLKKLEHWAHRLFPKLAFKDTLEQIEKLGAQKNVQVNMKKLRLDMFTEGGNEDEDNVLRGPAEDNTETTPVVDVFDELLGITPSAQPTSTTSIPMQTTLLPASQPPKPSTLTDEQKERMERNRKLAIEKRLARLKKQQEQEQQEQQQEQEKDESSTQPVTTSSLGMDIFDKLQGPDKPPNTEEDRREPPHDAKENRTNVSEKLDNLEKKVTQEAPVDSELHMDDVLDKLPSPEETVDTQKERREISDTEPMNGVENKCLEPVTMEEESSQASNEKENRTNVSEKLDNLDKKATQEAPVDSELHVDDIFDKLPSPEETVDTQKEISDAEPMNGVEDKCQEPVTMEEESQASNDTVEPMEPVTSMPPNVSDFSEVSEQMMDDV